MSLDDLLASRRVERVPEDPAAARQRVIAAQRHLITAAAIMADDPDAAYAVLYDAARKGFTASQVAHDLEHARGIVTDVALALAR